MSKRTIAKFFLFVIIGAASTLFTSACFSSNRANLPSEKPSLYDPPRIIGTITSPEIDESSGLASSKCQPDILWTHNDSGDGPFIFALDLTGKKLGTWRVPNATNTDWEDMASIKNKDGRCYLFIGEIGNNQKTRKSHAVYRITEPTVTSAALNSSKTAPQITEPADTISFEYPDGRHNAETLLVHPNGKDMYVITKLVSGPARIYHLTVDLGVAGTQTAKFIREIAVPAIPNGFLTGGDISPDGRRVIICDYAQAYEFIMPAESVKFDDIWSQTPSIVDIGTRAVGEAVCYSADGSSIFATSEKVGSPLIRVERRQ